RLALPAHCGKNDRSAVVRGARSLLRRGRHEPMTGTASTGEDVVALNQLAYRYARAVDACDVALFQSVFTPGARLHSYHPGAEKPFADLTGHAQLALVPETMRGMYGATTHMMTNHLVEIDGDSAAGEVLC